MDGRITELDFARFRANNSSVGPSTSHHIHIAHASQRLHLWDQKVCRPPKYSCFPKNVEVDARRVAKRLSQASCEALRIDSDISKPKNMRKTIVETVKFCTELDMSIKSVLSECKRVRIELETWPTTTIITPSNVEAINSFFEELYKLKTDGNTIFVMDECPLDTEPYRLYRWARAGTTAKYNVALKARKRHTLVMMISDKQTVHPIFLDHDARDSNGAPIKGLTDHIMSQWGELILQQVKKGDVIVMHNLAAHKQTAIITSLSEQMKACFDKCMFPTASNQVAPCFGTEEFRDIVTGTNKHIALILKNGTQSSPSQGAETFEKDDGGDTEPENTITEKEEQTSVDDGNKTGLDEEGQEDAAEVKHTPIEDNRANQLSVGKKKKNDTGGDAITVENQLNITNEHLQPLRMCASINSTLAHMRQRTPQTGILLFVSVSVWRGAFRDVGQPGVFAESFHCGFAHLYDDHLEHPR
ncbi:hypothetical protein PROFUN_00725 [Planoprotostelium fungivorum]|uniref:Uncharacterized protein n=1 Tax=Planoprotostelium fungivorum TaxID=1890364 RepID=A0A2P6NU71_9EUKA|nr:hypothetical protein PROFUN_00725 [Planoprotostelium fungivorum]